MATRSVTKATSLLTIPVCPHPCKLWPCIETTLLSTDEPESAGALWWQGRKVWAEGWGTGATKAFCCSVGVGLPALLCTLGLRFHVWRGEDRLRCSFWNKRGLFVRAQRPPEPGYKVTLTHCSAGNSYCKQTRVFPAGLLCANCGRSCWRRDWRPTFNCPHSDARLLDRSRCKDFSSPKKGCFHSSTFDVAFFCWLVWGM